MVVFAMPSPVQPFWRIVKIAVGSVELSLMSIIYLFLSWGCYSCKFSSFLALGIKAYFYSPSFSNKLAYTLTFINEQGIQVSTSFSVCLIIINGR